MANSRDRILGKLRAARQPFTDIPPTESPRRMVTMRDTSPGALLSRFVKEAEALHCQVQTIETEDEAVQQIMQLLGDDSSVMAWDFDLIPLPGLKTALKQANVSASAPDDDTVRVGVTGVDAALAATGSLILQSGPGKPRAASLLPSVAVAVMTADQLIPDLESWFKAQKAAGLEEFCNTANTVVVSGPSKTADIAQELILGAHGPIEVHILVLPAD